MAIDVRSKPERTYQTWLKESVLSSYVSAFVSYLSEHGYAANTVGFYLHSAAHFVHWLAKRKTGLHEINEGLVQRFITVHLPTCDCDGRCRRKADGTVLAALRHLLRVLRLKGGIPAGVGALPGAVQKELDRFDIYMERVCGLALRTRRLRLHYLGKFLSKVFKHGPIDLALLKSGSSGESVGDLKGSTGPRREETKKKRRRRRFFAPMRLAAEFLKARESPLNR